MNYLATFIILAVPRKNTAIPKKRRRKTPIKFSGASSNLQLFGARWFGAAVSC
jgi:hypothetical protein